MDRQPKFLLETLMVYGLWFIAEAMVLFASWFKGDDNQSHARHAALLARSLPPESDSGTHRPLSFIEYAADAAWRVSPVRAPIRTVGPTAAGEFLMKKIPGNVSITEYSPIVKESNKNLTLKVDGRFFNVFSMFFHAFKRFRHDRPDVVVASGPPFYVVITGFYLAKTLSAKLVLDYRDEWTLCPFEFVSKTRWDRWFEERCVPAADLIVYTTRSQMAAHQRAFRIPAHKQTVVANGWDEAVRPQSGRPIVGSVIDSDKINISYVGRLMDYADPRPFLNTLEKVLDTHPQLRDRVSVNFVGPKDPAMVHILESVNRRTGIIRSIDEVNKQDALTIMKSSTFLLLICEERLKNYVPGKLYDYVSTRVPIIAYGSAGEVSAILASTGSGHLVANRDISSLADVLNLPAEPVLGPQVDQWLEQHTRRNLALSFWREVDAVCQTELQGAMVRKSA